MFGLNLFKWIIICGLSQFQAAQVQSQVQGQVQGQVHKCALVRALVATSAHLYPALVEHLQSVVQSILLQLSLIEAYMNMHKLLSAAM